MSNGTVYKRGRFYWMQFYSEKTRMRKSTGKTTEEEAMAVLRATVERQGQPPAEIEQRSGRAASMEPASGVEFVVGDIVIRVSADADEQQLMRAIRVARAAAS